MTFIQRGMGLLLEVDTDFDFREFPSVVGVAHCELDFLPCAELHLSVA